MIDYMDTLVKGTNLNQKLPLREIIYKSIREAIISGIIPLGERIREKEYADRLNISRTPIRAALAMLEREEMIENIPGVGAVVSIVSMEDVKEIFTIRYNLEVLAATVAMDNISSKEVEELQKLLDLTEQENRKGNVGEVTRLIGEFNIKIHEASRMKRLVVMISGLGEYLKRFRDISMADPRRRETAIREHRRILKAISSRDKANIDNIIKKHLEDSRQAVIEEIGI